MSYSDYMTGLFFIKIYKTINCLSVLTGLKKLNGVFCVISGGQAKK